MKTMIGSTLQETTGSKADTYIVIILHRDRNNVIYILTDTCVS